MRGLAAVFRLVLTGAGPQLRRFYPCLGGDDPPEQGWPVLREVIAAHVDEIRAGLATAPQPNEVGQSAALLVVFVRPGRPVRGAADPVVITSRRGCDLAPVDPRTAAGRLLFTSFVWPFDLHRHHRLAAALEVAAEHPVAVDSAGAGSWLANQLTDTEPGVLPVVWPSVTELSWPPAELARVRQILTAYGQASPLGRVGMEYDPAGGAGAKPQIRTELWRPGRRRVTHRLGTAHDHGIPVRVRLSGGLPQVQ